MIEINAVPLPKGRRDGMGDRIVTGKKILCHSYIHKPEHYFFVLLISSHHTRSILTRMICINNGIHKWNNLLKKLVMMIFLLNWMWICGNYWRSFSLDSMNERGCWMHNNKNLDGWQNRGKTITFRTTNSFISFYSFKWRNTTQLTVRYTNQHYFTTAQYNLLLCILAL